MDATDWVAWGGIAQFAAAFATIGLAGVTLYMAIKTRDVATEARKESTAANSQAEATRELAELTRRSLDSDREPFLLPTVQSEPWDPERIRPFNAEGRSTPAVQDFAVSKVWLLDTKACVVVKIRNVGSGVAVIENGDEGVCLRDLPGWADYFPGGVSSRVIAPGDRANVVFDIDSSKGAAENTVHSFVSAGYYLHLCLRYGDVGGQNRFESVFEIGGERPDPEVNLTYRNASLNDHDHNQH